MTDALALLGGPKRREQPFPAWPVHGPEEEQALIETLRSGQWGVGGSQKARFEQAFADHHDAKYGIAVTSGTVALRLALLAADIKAGDEVIVPPYTFLSTATAVIECNALPIFVDIDPETFNLDIRRIERAITARTRAITPVHFAGLAADMDAILALGRKHSLTVIEDAAHAHGGDYKGRKLGSWGDMACFSFQSSKNMTAGEGGIITTNDSALADRCRSIHNCGRMPDGAWYDHRLIGGNYRLGEFQAAVLNCQLERLDEQTRRRDANGRHLARKLAGVPGIRPLPRSPHQALHPYHLFMFRYDAAGFDDLPRERFLEALAAEGIPAGSGYPVGLYQQPLFAQRNFGPYTSYEQHRPGFAYRAEDYPATERASQAEACWIHQAALNGDLADMDDIAAAVAKVYNHRQELLTCRQA